MPEMSATTACLIVAGSSLAIYVVIALWVIWRLSRRVPFTISAAKHAQLNCSVISPFRERRGADARQRVRMPTAGVASCRLHHLLSGRTIRS